MADADLPEAGQAPSPAGVAQDPQEATAIEGPADDAAQEAAGKKPKHKHHKHKHKSHKSKDKKKSKDKDRDADAGGLSTAEGVAEDAAAPEAVPDAAAVVGAAPLHTAPSSDMQSHAPHVPRPEASKASHTALDGCCTQADRSATRSGL